MIGNCELNAPIFLVDHAEFLGGAEMVGMRLMRELDGAMSWLGPLSPDRAHALPLPSPKRDAVGFVKGCRRLRDLRVSLPSAVWVANTSRAALYLQAAGVVSNTTAVWIMHDHVLARPLANLIRRGYKSVLAAGPSVQEWFRSDDFFWPRSLLDVGTRRRSVSENLHKLRRSPLVLGYGAGRLSKDKGAYFALGAAHALAERGRTVQLRAYVYRPDSDEGQAYVRAAENRGVSVDLRNGLPGVSPVTDDEVALWLSPSERPEAASLLIQEALMRNAPLMTVCGDGRRLPRGGSYWTMATSRGAGALVGPRDFIRTVVEYVSDPVTQTALIEAFAEDSRSVQRRYDDFRRDLAPLLISVIAGGQ